MTQGSVGWLCPKCSAIISPYQATCSTCAPSAGLGFGTKSGPMYTFTSGTFSFRGISAGGTVVMAPPKTDAQKLEEAQSARVKAERRAEKYSTWADKVITFYERLDELTQELDDLTDEPDRIEDD